MKIRIFDQAKDSSVLTLGLKQTSGDKVQLVAVDSKTGSILPGASIILTIGTDGILYLNSHCEVDGINTDGYGAIIVSDEFV